MSKHKISTFRRFLYLNSYAFLLLFVGAGVALIPLYKVSLWLIIPQAVITIVCLHGTRSIFSSWNSKKRKYDVLIQKNSEKFRPDTFTEFMQAPCGRLLVKVVLEDRKTPELYAQLKPLQKPLVENLRTACRPQKTVVYIAPTKK